MKKAISFVSLVLIVLAGMTSCSKDNGEIGDKSKGGLKITLGFTKPMEIPEGRAYTPSDAKPVTTWAKNIKSLQLVLTTSTGLVKDIRTITYSPAVDHVAITPATFTDIVAGTYDVYVIANLDQTGSPFASGTAAAHSLVIGDNLATKLYKLSKVTPWPATEVTGSNGYSEPAEIFLAKKANVNVPSEGTAEAGTLNLTRMTSLLRVRIDKSDAVNAAPIDFDRGAGIRLRRHGNSLNLSTGVVTKATDDVFYSAKTFKTAEPVAADYAGGKVLTDQFTLWNDYLILPGGGTTTGTGFNIAISGLAPAGYKLADGTTVPAGPGLIVWWQGTVTSAITANGILDLGIKITTPGAGGPGVPPVADYGSLNISVDLIEWGAIVSKEMEL